MALPLFLLTSLKKALDDVNTALLKAERHRLSDTYRQDQPSSKRPIETKAQRLSYLATRLPATYAVCETVFGQLKTMGISVTSLLDLGAGPGTAALCAQQIFPELNRLTLMDHDKDFKALAEVFLSDGPGTAASSYELANIATTTDLPSHDVAILSYAVNELSDTQASATVQRAWHASTQALVIIEPGTPKAFKRLKNLRQDLIEAGATLAAPCTHNGVCPLADNDWCHFSVRLDRNTLHRKIKEATLGYEDEKFSYLIALKGEHTLARPPQGRIIKRPLKRPGHIIFDLCTEKGVQRETLSKKTKAAYKAAKTLAWGDLLNFGTQQKDDPHG